MQRFEEKRSAFVQAWREGDRKRFHWTMAHQQEYSKAYKDAETAKKQQEATFSKLKKEMESLQNSDRQARMGKNKDKSTEATLTPGIQIPSRARTLPRAHVATDTTL